MIRRLLCACMGAVFVCLSAVPARAGAKPPDLPEDGSFTLAPAPSPFAPFNQPRLVEKKRDNRCDPFRLGMNDDVLKDVPREIGRTPIIRSFFAGGGEPIYDRDWLLWIVSHWTARQPPPPPEQNDGYLQSISMGSDFASQFLSERMAPENETHRYLRSFNAGLDFAYHQAVSDTTASEDETSEHSAEVLPMPKEEPEVTCPYLRQQQSDRQACPMVNPEIGRGVLDNLKLLEEADNLLELAKKLADDGYIDAAMECCDEAAELCPGSPCAARAAATMHELALGSAPPSKGSEEAAEQKSKTNDASGQEHDPNERVLQQLNESEESLRNIEYEWERLWFEELPSRLTPKQPNGDVGSLKGSRHHGRKRSKAEQTIEKKLKQPTSMEFNNVSLRHVLDALRDSMGVNIYVDQAALEEKGISLDTPINVKSEQISYKSALRLLLQSIHLGYLIEDDVVKITTEENACGKQTPHVYAIAEPADEVPDCESMLASAATDPGIELMVSGLMKACHLLMNQGMQHQAAELAQQAYALDPQRVMADPLIYKMHLLADSPTARPTGASEESEPQTCPYCPSAGQPIREIVPQKKKGHPKDTSQRKPTLIENLPFEIAANAEGELRVNAECTLGGNVYHLRYTHGSLAIWTTTDDSQTKP